MTDDELTTLALAEADDTVDADAVPWDQGGGAGLLPSWYMPVSSGGAVGGWRRGVVIALIVAFLAITAYGLCSTYGQVEFL
ncbi:MAG: hypothetical protein ACRDY7_10975 [Acidimicrobiia bacterium]